MAELKYGKYIIRNLLVANQYPPYTPCLLFESKNYFPNISFSVRYTYIDQPIRLETVHTHDFDQLFCFIGTPQDVREFDGEIELYLGAEGVKNTIDKTSVAYIPRGLVHGPIIFKRVDKPVMLFNCALTAQYSRTETPAGAATAAEGAGRPVANPYEKYIIREPYQWTIFPPYTPRLLFDCNNYFPNTGFGIRYTYIDQPIDMEKPHAHDFDQVLCNLGTPEDISVFDATAEVYLGEEGEKNIIDSTAVMHIPANLVHGPSLFKRVDKPMMLFNVILTPRYTRSDQQSTFYNFMELSARQVTLEEAARVLGAGVPLPAYLPAGYRVQEIYVQDNTVKLLVGDTPVVMSTMTLGDASGTRQRYSYECKLELDITWHPDGKSGGLTVPGEPVKLNRGNGVLVDQENYTELHWLLPSAPGAGQYEIVLSASKVTPRDELLKVAQSVAA